LGLPVPASTPKCPNAHRNEGGEQGECPEHPCDLVFGCQKGFGCKEKGVERKDCNVNQLGSEPSGAPTGPALERFPVLSPIPAVLGRAVRDGVPWWKLIFPLLPTQLFGRVHRRVALDNLIGICLPTGHSVHRPPRSVEPPLHLGVVGVGKPTWAIRQCTLGHRVEGITEKDRKTRTDDLPQIGSGGLPTWIVISPRGFMRQDFGRSGGPFIRVRIRVHRNMFWLNRDSGGVILSLVGIAALFIFMIQNTEKIRVHFLF